MKNSYKISCENIGEVKLDLAAIIQLLHFCSEDEIDYRIIIRQNTTILVVSMIRQESVTLEEAEDNIDQDKMTNVYKEAHEKEYFSLIKY